MRAESPLVASRSRRRERPALLTLVFAAGSAALLVLLLGLAFSGSKRELAEGTRVGGVDVGGLTEQQAVAVLGRRFDERADVPVTFTAGETNFSFAASQLGVRPDWKGAVEAASRAGDGFGPIRGFRRLRMRFFGADVLPRIGVSNAVLEFALDKIADRVNRTPESAALVRRGLDVASVPGVPGRELDREAAAEVLARALGSLERGAGRVPLPVVAAIPPVSRADLARAALRARTAFSGPVVLEGAGRRWRLTRARIAQLVVLPRDGARDLAIAGPAASGYFAALARLVGKPARDARFAVSGEGVEIVPSTVGTTLDVPASTKALLRAVTSPTKRVARLTIVRAEPKLTTADAMAMGIDRRLSTYKTYNSGTADRITNLRLGVSLLDDTLVAPGGTFSLNEALGERTLERGFRPAPVIIGTEYAEEVGGGTSQVATTAFNAAWEAGLRITERNPHSLYISRYQLGRDATVYWPTLDLKFVNDTEKWILVKGFSEWDGIRISIYGGESRRVESSPGTMEVTGKAPVERVEDPLLRKGRTVVESEGAAPRRTSVTRTVYAPDGTLLRTETWTTSYKAEPRVVRVGTKVSEPRKDAPKVAGDPKVPGKDEAGAPAGEDASPSPSRP